jgi:hypothetical protein
MKDRMGRTYSRHNKQLKMHTTFLFKNVKERDPLETLNNRWEDNIKMALSATMCSLGSTSTLNEYGNELLDSIESEEFFGQVKVYDLYLFIIHNNHK